MPLLTCAGRLEASPPVWPSSNGCVRMRIYSSTEADGLNYLSAQLVVYYGRWYGIVMQHTCIRGSDTGGNAGQLYKNLASAKNHGKRRFLMCVAFSTSSPRCTRSSKWILRMQMNETRGNSPSTVYVLRCRFFVNKCRRILSADERVRRRGNGEGCKDRRT